MKEERSLSSGDCGWRRCDDGADNDLRDDKQFFQDHLGAVPITTVQGEELRKLIGALVYIECSSKTQQNVKAVFDAAIKVVLQPPKQKKKKRKGQKTCSIFITHDGVGVPETLLNQMFGREGQESEEGISLLISRKLLKLIREGKGDEKPGYLPADIVFIIKEKKHNLFRREGNNDLEICIEIPLVDALTECSLPIPILGGENLTLSFENTVVYLGYVKVIVGQGMPTLKNDGKRGDLHVKFLVDFPKELSDEQRQEAFRILENCC
ncbi:hypothetical protein S83_020426 [Arachis hypogaea]